MLNQLILVGRMTEKRTINTENEVKKCEITLSVPRSFKNTKGEYEYDNIKCLLYHGIAEQTMEWCNPGDLIGIKGRIQVDNEEMEIVAEKVTFLSSKKKEEE